VAALHAGIPRQTKVEQFDLVFPCDHYVFRLNVPVDNTQGVTVVDSGDQLLHIQCRLLLSESLVVLLSNFVKQWLSIDKLHYQIDVLLIVVGLKVLDDVWVVEGVENAHFLHD